MLKQTYTKRLLYFLILLVLVACQSKSSLSFVHQFANNEWNAFDLVKFDTSLTEREQPYQVQVTVVLTEEFIGHEISFALSQQNDNGESVFNHYEIPIRDQKANWIQQPIDGKFYYTLIIHKDALFSSEESYHFIFEITQSKFTTAGVHQLKLDLIPN
jgi:gliding motility-associated lipoprotein GldH